MGTEKTPQTHDQYRWRLRMLLLHGAMFTAPVLLLLMHQLLHQEVFGVCIAKLILGVDCPACGITRSAMALLSGDISGSFHFHPAGPLVIAVLGIMTSYLLFTLLTFREGLGWRREVKVYNMIDVTIVVLLLVGWIGRELSL